MENIEFLLNPPESSSYIISNPYSINRNLHNESDRKSKNIENSQFKNTEFFQHLTKIYSFWRILLPKIYRNLEEIEMNKSRNKIEYIVDKSENVGVPQFKSAFFSMLLLVCLLLAILCVCMYLLKKNKDLNTNYL